MRIAVIFTGGTIGSHTGNRSIGLSPAAKYRLLEPFSGEDITFDVTEPYAALSETLNADKLNRLQAAVGEALATAPDGVIVTHGTDTLPYTAAALSLAFGDAAVPIVLVSAAYPLDDPRTNGYDNFEAAIVFIRDGRLGGTFVSYRNDGDVTMIHAAHRLLLHAEGASDLHSVGGKTVAAYDGTLHRCAAPLPPPAVCGIVPYRSQPPILTVESRPEERYAYALDGIRAVLLKPYHSATLDTDSAALRTLCREAQQRHIPVYICGTKDGPAYESCRHYEALHIRPAPCDTFVSSFMTLWATFSLEDG